MQSQQITMLHIVIDPECTLLDILDSGLLDDVSRLFHLRPNECVKLRRRLFLPA